MPYLLDTSVAIPFRDGDADTTRRLLGLDDSRMLSIITQVELEGGVYQEPAMALLRRTRLDAMLEVLSVLPFDQDCALAYRRIIETVGFSRRKVLDRMIGAQALVHDATLVTLNPKDFQDIPGLDLMAW